MPFINDKLRAVQDNHRERDERERRTAAASRYKFDVQDVMEKLRASIYGQERALEAMEHMLMVVKAEISDPEKPLYIGLFLGPTGVGKTEIVKVLAEAIYGDRNHFCRVDMNTLSLEHYAAALTGAPPGYVGSKEGASVLDKEKIEGTYSRPGIILFDEIEKASHQVIQALLNVFDNGLMRMSSGSDVIDFKNTMIFMTSNLGAREIFQFTDRRFSYLFQRLTHYMQPKNWGNSNMEPLLEKLMKKKLERTFPPEYLNRMDDMIIFEWLRKTTMNRMIDKLMQQMLVRLGKHHCQLLLQESAVSFLMEEGYDKRYGGRAMKRALRKYVEVPLADRLIRRPDKEHAVTYKVERRGGESRLSFVEVSNNDDLS
ncbi:AAA family ATPase [Paenibacillus eucommiae]|uniref:ATP-dependent Clp protease ATP-binding subunit ClpA n=1 Tax=Paenibacillus eucommiae TaxID=1355755 RepID=A0ABS4J2I2_9BACL|nr:AAA family ATPase [Paenibacillus eucommiae]MBP1994040.1 ATP-dependent Clp protease ATP-binding subunit ClpA [Paenibacillus eucommiae]